MAECEAFFTRFSDLGSIDKNLKSECQFQWQWLKERDCNGDMFSGYIEKLKLAGHVFCKFCEWEVNHTRTGKKGIRCHARTEEHKRKRKLFFEFWELPEDMFRPKPKPKGTRKGFIKAKKAKGSQKGSTDKGIPTVSSGVALVSPPTCGDVSMQKLSVDDERKAETCPARGGTSCVVSVSDSAKEIQSLSVAEPASHLDTPEPEGEPRVSSSTHIDLLPGTAYREEEEKPGGAILKDIDNGDCHDICGRNSEALSQCSCSICGITFSIFLDPKFPYRCKKCVMKFGGGELRKFYICSTCGLKTSSDQNFQTSSKDGKELTCLTCGQRRSVDYMVNNREPIVCPTCGKALPSLSTLKQHINTHLFQCVPCSKSFTRKGDFIEHMNIHKIKKKCCKCSICKRLFSDSDTLKIHMATQHLCSICGKICTNGPVLRTHMRTHTGEKPYLCPVCGRQFCDYTSFVRHKKLHTGDKPYKCKQCGKTFRQNYTLSCHVLTVHKKIKPHKCGICGKCFYFNWQLTNHSATHTDDGHFKCTVCSQEFFKEEDLQGHKKTHAELVNTTNAKWKEKADPKCRIYQCTLCTKTYSTYHGLWYHKKTHSNTNTKHECSICGKMFASQSSLHKHMVVHSGEKVLCSICGNVLSSQRSLNRHMKLHRDEKNFACTICSKRFLDSYLLKVHMTVHTRQKPYQCSICHKAFSHPSSVGKHKKLFHS